MDTFSKIEFPDTRSSNIAFYVLAAVIGVPALIGLAWWVHE